MYRFCDSKMLSPSHRRERMINSTDQSIRTNHHIISDIHLPDIQDRQVIISRKVIADMNLLTIVTVKILLVLVIGLLVISLLEGIWYIVNPESVRAFNRKFPEWDRHGKMRNASNIYIRLSGVIIILFAGFILYGLWNLYNGLK